MRVLALRNAILLVAMMSAAAWTTFMSAAEDFSREFLESHCYDCHDASEKKGGLDLSALKLDLDSTENFARWVKVFDRVSSGEMPPKDIERPGEREAIKFTQGLRQSLVKAEGKRFALQGRTKLRRLTRVEYENTVRDLFDMPGIALRDGLPADGSAHGFDTNSDALSISHVNLAKYMEAADHILNFAIATQPKKPTQQTQRISLTSHYYIRLLLAFNGGAVMLKDKKPDPAFPATSEHQHIDVGAHERIGMFDHSGEKGVGMSVGVFRHEDESFQPSFQRFAAIYPGKYRFRTSLWSYQWDKGKVLPSRGVEAVRLSAMQLTNRGLGGGHPSYTIGYFDAPSLESKEHEFVHWMNPHDTIKYNVASLAPVHIYHQYKRNVMSFTGPGIACDWLEIEGPLHDIWPPRAHRVLFGELPLVEMKQSEHPDLRLPKRTPWRQMMIGAANRPDPNPGLWTVQSNDPLKDADRLLASFLPKAFRRPVDAEIRKQYLAKVEERLQAGDCFELAMRWVYRAALCSSDFLYHFEPENQLDDFALANRMSYLLWNSMPDDTLTELASQSKLREPAVLRGQVERMLKDGRSQRFIEDFLGQWLSLRKIAATDPDRKLYPEFGPYLQDSMVAETQAYFRELIEKDLDASHLIKSDFAMINEKLATHYGIEGVSGSQIRRVALPADCPRGGFLTQGSILKITANGTTTSPVPRGAFVMDRLLGQPPEPPPENISAIEPDVRGAKTIREQLDKHRHHVLCASCHAKIDPPGFALESFDVIGGFRTRYRSIGKGDPAPRGSIDPFIHIGFRLGPAVDSSGKLPNAKKFDDIRQFQMLIAKDTHRLLSNLARQLATYGTGREVAFSDRDSIDAVVGKTENQGGGVRTLIHELIQSRLFQTR